MKVVKYIGLGSLPFAYSDLFEQASHESIFLSFPWFKNFEETIVGPNERVMIYGVEECGGSGRPVAALILRQEHSHPFLGLFKIAKIESLSNYYTSYFGLVISNSLIDEEEIIDAITQALFEDRYKWDILNLKPLDPLSPFFVALVKSFKRVGLVVQTYFCFGNWYLDVAGRNYSEYFEGLPSYIRKKIPYKKRKLEKNFSVSIKIIMESDAVDRAMYDYAEVYRASWKKPEPFPDFIRGFAKEASKQGWLRLGLLYLGEKPVAAQLWVVHNNVASIYKLAYAEQFSHLSVGIILSAYLMEYVINVDKVRQVDYLTGDDDYKKDWMSARRERWGILVFNPQSSKGLMQAIRHIAGREVKRAATKILSLIKT